jgi:spore coat polysaccharide biosynthesis protein SpsF
MPDKLVIIQARTTSTRLPNKILLKVLNKEILLHVLDRVLAARKVDHIIVATTDQPADQVIADLIQLYHPRISLFRGSEEDVLDRYYQAARLLMDNTGENCDIIRITSDCPLIDPQFIDLHVKEFNKRKVDYLSSRIYKRTWPHGMELEIFSFQTLQMAWQQAVDKYEREHVTPYIYSSHAEKFTLYELKSEKDWSHIRLTLDYWEDYLLIKTIYEKLYPINPFFGLAEILKLLTDEGNLLQLNSKWSCPQLDHK